ncbi:peptide/nickel transport system permease protein [Paracoccus aminovorans]|uniref:Peptide/nickel transport system permease protein n=1 Tax=Paracoccus aminovorans TaxID=34004 RepID=A0A1I2ZFB3_9RHOB|nr:peptide/nickel transport system, permease protein [Paracoccus aminovorans]SFH36400.1 peptide/nickel transport system permease protein [Paracoccus aminovorans]
MVHPDTAAGAGQGGLSPAGGAPPSPSHRGARLRRRARAVAGLVLSLLLTLLGLLLVTFVIGRVMPIDPVLKVVGERATQAQYEAARIAMGLDKPLWQQFLLYMAEVLRGDFGRSISTGHPVAQDLRRVFPATLELATLGTLIGVCVGVPLGVVAAARRGGWIDQIARVVALVGYSMPIFWLGLMGLLLFYGILGWVGGPGRQGIIYDGMVPEVTGMILLDSLLAGDWAAFRDAFGHIVLPASLLGYFSLAYVSRMTRSFMLEQLSAEYVTTARVKGLSERRVIWGHAFRNILVPLVTVIALSFASLLEGSVLTEIVFSWPGIGQYITKALLAGDMNAVLGGTVVIGTCFVVLNLLSDILYRLLDPRAK